MYTIYQISDGIYDMLMKFYKFCSDHDIVLQY